MLVSGKNLRNSVNGSSRFELKFINSMLRLEIKMIQDSSVGSALAWYAGGWQFESRKGEDRLSDFVLNLSKFKL